MRLCSRTVSEARFETITKGFTRALVLLVPLLAVGSKSTSLSAGFLSVSTERVMQLVFCCVLSFLN